MIVFVNENLTEVQAGAKVQDAIIKHDEYLFIKVKRGIVKVKDQFGNIRLPDGILTEKDHLYIIQQ